MRKLLTGLFIFLLVPLVLAGCAGNKQKKELAQQSELSQHVQSVLGQAAEESHANLAMLARLRGKGITPVLPPPDPALGSKLTVSWTGPADEILKEICLQVGYKYREVGRKRAQTTPVVVKAFDVPAYDIIEDVAWQVQPHLAVRVNTVDKSISLSGTGGQ